MNLFNRNIALWIVIVLLLALLYSVFQGGSTRGSFDKISYSEFLSKVDQGQVRQVTIQGSMQGSTITGQYRDPGARGAGFTTFAPTDPRLIERLEGKVEKIDAGPLEESMSLGAVLVNWLPLLVLIGVYIFFMRQMQSGTGRAMGFGKSRARLLTEKVGSSRVDLQACKLEYSIVSPK